MDNSRWKYTPPWKLNRLGLVWPLVGLGMDEWCNHSVSLIVPLLGCVDFWFEPHIDRSQPMHDEPGHDCRCAELVDWEAGDG